jgi:hypothetical protein
MTPLAKDPWAPPQTDVPAPKAHLTELHSTERTEYKPPSGPSKAILSPGPCTLLTVEQERVMVEHPPIVRIIARRIHEQLPQHVPIDDLYGAEV